MTRPAAVLALALALCACASSSRQAPDAAGFSDVEIGEYRAAAAALDAGDAALALRTIEPLAAREPWHVPSHLLRQDALAALGRAPQAASWYADEAARRPDDPARALLAARVAPREGGVREAAYRAAAALDPSSVWPRIALSYELLRRARDDAGRATKLGDGGFVAEEEAALKDSAAAYAEAERTARAAAAQRPDLGAAQAAIADVLLAVPSGAAAAPTQDALMAAEAALALDGGSAAAWGRAGRARRAMSRDDDAAKAFAKAAEIAPHDASWRADLGRVLLDLRRDAEARDALAAAARLDPADETTSLNLAVALFRTKDLAAAEAEFDRAASLATTDPRPLEGLALTRAARGDRRGAAEAMERRVALGGADIDAAQRFVDDMRGAPRR